MYTTLQSWLQHPRSLFVVAIVIRLVMVLYGLWQDSVMAVKYTDIDYEVITDGARLLVQGKSPYDRATYRYTPLLAMMMIPNVLLFKDFGKLIFLSGDIVIGVLLYRILHEQAAVLNLSTQKLLLVVSAWLFNPIAINVSTRGNSEAVVGTLVLISLLTLIQRRYILAGIWYGLAVHFKIYPAIYCLALYLYIESTSEEADASKKKRSFVQWFLAKNRVIFAVSAMITFLLITFIMYKLYGFAFLHETYLYHQRTPEEAILYPQEIPSLWASRAQAFISFIPQAAVILALSVKYYKRIGLCIFLQTLAFVAFNKVCTVQYFVWYFSLAPLAIVHVKLNLRQYAVMFLLWAATQGYWLYSAYRLEFLGENTFLQVWLAGVLFFTVNIGIIVAFMRTIDPDVEARAKQE